MNIAWNGYAADRAHRLKPTHGSTATILTLWTAEKKQNHPMAIYQFSLATIPKKGMIEYFGAIPTRLEIDFQKQTEDFLNEAIEDEFDYFEFIQHKCWDLAKINPKDIIRQMDQSLERANWGNNNDSNNWKTKTDEVDNDAWIFTNEQQDQIMEFTFRVDLRQPRLKFLIEMIEMSKEKELLFIDSKGNIIEPEIANVLELIKQSNALKFIENPFVFLADIKNGEIEIE